MANIVKKPTMTYSLIVVGSGGTGTYVLKELSRFLSGGNMKNIKRFTIVDGDTVEEKNLARQAFTEEDLGQNKAAVMADVLRSAFNVPWDSYGEYLVDTEPLDRFVYPGTVPVIVGCVDNHPCRLILEAYFRDTDTVFYLDSANEFDTGEAVFAYKAKKKVISPCRSHYFPKIKEKAKARTEMSCEELNNAEPQHIATNMAAGNILLTELCSLFNGVTHPGLVTFDLSLYSQEYIPYGKEARL